MVLAFAAIVIHVLILPKARLSSPLRKILPPFVAHAARIGINSRGGILRWFQTLPVGRKRVYIVLSVPRVAWLSTVPLEGTNNKIKTLQKQASGFRDMEFFKLKIYALNETKYALAG